MFTVNVERKERAPQSLSIRPATIADLDYIIKLHNENLGRPDNGDITERNNMITNHLLNQTKNHTGDQRQLLSFIAYVGDKPAGCVLVEREKRDQNGERNQGRDLKGIDTILSSRELKRAIRAGRDYEHDFRATVPSFIVAGEFRSNPQVLSGMVGHLLRMREKRRPFSFELLAKDGTTTHRLVKSRVLQEKLREFGYVVDDTGIHIINNQSKYHRIMLRPMQRWEKIFLALQRRTQKKQ